LVEDDGDESIIGLGCNMASWAIRVELLNIALSRLLLFEREFVTDVSSSGWDGVGFFKSLPPCSPKPLLRALAAALLLGSSAERENGGGSPNEPSLGDPALGGPLSKMRSWRCSPSAFRFVLLTDV
jgi:hypothetical protein